MRAKKSRFSIICGGYRLPAGRRITEEFINLAHTTRFSRFRRHTHSGYAQSRVANHLAFCDPVVLTVCGKRPGQAECLPYARWPELEAMNGKLEAAE